jgi:hypothetical protein
MGLIVKANARMLVATVICACSY